MVGAEMTESWDTTAMIRAAVDRAQSRSVGLLLAIFHDDGRIGIPPNPSIIEGSWQMTPSEMEEQIKNLNQWASEVAQYLPLLATKEDLKVFATKEDLKAFATKEDLKAFATKEDLKVFATKED